jgi:hypothetical protein
MAQKHSDEDDIAVVSDLCRFFENQSYIRVNGKPLILIYRVGLFPDFRRTAETWRRVCREKGIGDIYIAMVESFEHVHLNTQPSDYGCDAAVEFPPQGMAQTYELNRPLYNRNFKGHVADYNELAIRYCVRDGAPYKRFAGITPGWDNTARRQNDSFCIERATPGAFQAWATDAIARTKQQFVGEERLLFINAWNEWAEGAYLEPDRRFGHSFLEAFKNAQEYDQLIGHTNRGLWK